MITKVYLQQKLNKVEGPVVDEICRQVYAKMIPAVWLYPLTEAKAAMQRDLEDRCRRPMEVIR